MFEFTFVQKLMLLGLGSIYLWFFMWIWRSSSTNWTTSTFSFSLKKKKDITSSLDYTPAEGYFDQIQKTKKRFGGSWFNKK